MNLKDCDWPVRHCVFGLCLSAVHYQYCVLVCVEVLVTINIECWSVFMC